MIAGDADPIRSALTPLTELLRIDGYDLEVVQADTAGVALQIHAGAEACAECLVPASIMELYVRDALKDLPAWRDARLDLRYPQKGS